MMPYKKIIGNFGENIACIFLKKRGYKIIERNIKLSYQEIDIVAKHDKKIIFIEVKTRTSKYLGAAEDSLYSSQIKNLKKAITNYCYKNYKNLSLIRLDFIAIDIDKKNKTIKIKHYKNIF